MQKIVETVAQAMIQLTDVLTRVMSYWLVARNGCGAPGGQA